MEVVIFIGIQASGKTTFYRERFFETHIRLSLDMLHTRHRERLLIQACFLARQRFVVDNTHVLAAHRAKYISMARQAGFRVVGYYFETGLRAAIARNSTRPGKRAIPVKGVIGTFKRLQPPTLAEGFDELFSVRPDPDNRFRVSPYAAGADEGAAHDAPA